jgi:hypothetical protein
VRLSAAIVLLCGLAASRASAQTELLGAARDAARAAIVYPVVFDPLLMSPLAPGPEAVVEAHGSDVAATAHIALRNGDDSYGILASTPIGSADPATSVDPRGMRRHASLGFELTNIIWHPKHADGVPYAFFIHADYRFNRAEYDYVDAQTSQQKTDTRLNDTASMLFGAQLFSTKAHPGYFVAFSYHYTAVFQGLPNALPQKVRGNLVRVELRHPFEKRFGLNPSIAFDNSSRVTTVDATGYARLRHHTYVGARAGHESEHDGRGGAYASVFLGWTTW